MAGMCSTAVTMTRLCPFTRQRAFGDSKCWLQVKTWRRTVPCFPLRCFTFSFENNTFTCLDGLVFNGWILFAIWWMMKTPTSLGLPPSGCRHVGACGDCTILFSAWLLNMKVFLVIKYNLLVEVITFNFYGNIYNFVLWSHTKNPVPHEKEG